MEKILVVEDDEQISELLQLELGDQGFAVDLAADGESGLSKLQDGDYTLAVVDIMLPKLTGLEICKQLRKDNNQVPILLLTAKREEIDRVLGLELGADDYLCKPFSVHELVARIRAILRRVQPVGTTGEAEPIEYKDLRLDINRRMVHIKGVQIDLTTREFDILAFLASHPGRPFTRDELLAEIWGYSHAGYENNVNTHINRLRNKIETTRSRPTYIKTLRGFGYYFGDREE